MKLRVRLCDDCFLKAVRDGFDCEIKASAQFRGTNCSYCGNPRREMRGYDISVSPA